AFPARRNPGMPAGSPAERPDHRHDQFRYVQRGSVQLRSRSASDDRRSRLRHDSGSARGILSRAQRIEETDTNRAAGDLRWGHRTTGAQRIWAGETACPTRLCTRWRSEVGQTVSSAGSSMEAELKSLRIDRSQRKPPAPSKWA